MKLNVGLIRNFGVALAIILLVLMLGRFFSHSYARAITNSNSGNGDQGAFLQLGLELREMGRLTDGTRNPLYPALLGTFAHRDLSYFTSAKLLSIFFGLLTIVAVFVLVLVRYGSIYVCISTRHVIIPVILCLGWGGAGVVEIENRLKRLLLKKSGGGTKIAHSSWFRWTLLLLILLALLPMTLASQRLDKIAVREAGAWIKENGPSTPVILGDTGLARVGFYAEGRFLEIPVGEDLFEYARAQGVDFLVVKDRSIGPSQPDLVEVLDSRHFSEKVVIGDSSESHVIRIYRFER